MGRAPAAAWLLAALLAGTAGSARPARAQAADSGVVAGVVRDRAGNEIAAAEITAAGSEARAVTDGRGGFILRNLPRAAVTLRVRRLGYAPVSLTHVVTGGFAEPIEVVLEQVAQRLASVVVHTSRRNYFGYMGEFNRRRDAGSTGHFITRAQIDSMRPTRTTDLLRTVPGVHLARNDLGDPDIWMRDRRCRPMMWIDGMAITGPFFNPDNMSPRSIEGIEIYNGLASVPAALMAPSGKGQCGVIAIWSRLGDPRPRRRGKQMTPAQLAKLVESSQVYLADQVDEPAQLIEAVPLEPVYPDELRRSGTAGAVIAEFVVDTAGRVEPASFGVVASAHPLFTQAVEEAISEAFFVPAARGGRRVRQVVHLPVYFIDDAASVGAPVSRRPEKRER